MIPQKKRGVAFWKGRGPRPQGARPCGVLTKLTQATNLCSGLNEKKSVELPSLTAQGKDWQHYEALRSEGDHDACTSIHGFTRLKVTRLHLPAARCRQAKADERGYHPARKWSGQHVEPMTIETNSICGAMKLHHTRTEAATAE